MYGYLKLISFCSAMISMAAAGTAAPAIIDSFEISSDPPGWQTVSSPNQTVNAANGVNANVPYFRTEHVTHGTQAGEFVTTWTLPGSAISGSNPHVSGGPTLFWSLRCNIATPASMVSNSINVNTGLFEADIYNNNPYPISITYIFDNTLVTGQLKRGPYLTIPANSSGTYSWDMQNPVAWVTGGTSDWAGGQSARVRSMLLYTDTAPTVPECSIFVDNIRDSNAQGDVTPPAVPVMYSVTQGTSVGELLVKWKANTEPDLAEYRVYQASDSNFGNPTTNRLTFPTTPVATVAAGTNQVTLTGVPTDQNVYITVRAADSAVPSPNLSEAGVALGARLKGDGSAVDDRVVLDLNRNAPGTAEFTLEGYLQDIVYNAKALNALNRSFDSVSALAIDNAIETLQPSPTGITIWSNLLDGNSSASVSLTTASVNALTTFYNANGNLMISGAGLAEDLSTRGPAQQGFLQNQLKASLLNPAIGQQEITGTAPFASIGTVRTNGGIFVNNVAFSTISNEQFAAEPGASLAGQYNGSSSPDAAVVHGNRVVYLGFAFESVAATDDTIASTELVRQNLLQDIITYLLDTSAVYDWSLF